VYLLAVVIASCTTFSREKEQQSKIDSLANELKKRDSAIKNVSVKEEVPKDTFVLAENSELNEENDAKEIVAKKKEQKNAVLADEKDHEGKKGDDVTDDIVKTSSRKIMLP
jgi:hypothetical protein